MSTQTDSTPQATAEAPDKGVGCNALLANPFALFAGRKYYPHPGWQGHCGQFSSIEDAATKGKKLAEDEYGWWQVVDLRLLEIVAGEGSGHTGLFGECPAFVANHPQSATRGGQCLNSTKRAEPACWL